MLEAHVGRHAREMTGLVRPNGFVWLCEPILEFPGFGGRGRDVAGRRPQTHSG